MFFAMLVVITIQGASTGVLGILNNISIGFIQRKKSMVVLSSVGMSVSQRTGMLIVESIVTIIWPALMIYAFAPVNMQMEVPIPFTIELMPKIIILADEPIGNLDSKTGTEIMRLFKQINKEFHTTIVQVTHSKESSLYGNRIIHLKDGIIVSEETNHAIKQPYRANSR